MALLNKEAYYDTVQKAVDLGLITWKEWEEDLQHMHDNIGHSMHHYLDAVIRQLENPDDTMSFITHNPKMLQRRAEFEERFKVKIKTIMEMVADES